MLYQRWLQTVREHRNELALQDLASGRRWSFDDLRTEAENHILQSTSVVFPQSHSAQFILDVLAGWRLGKMVCPLEPGQTAPRELVLPPSGCIHLKTTSASTGAPRMVAFKAEQLMADAENIVATMKLRPDWPNLGVISLAHSYGFSNLVLPLLLHGIPLLIGSSALPEAVRSASRAFQEITLASVPALWRAWHDSNAIPTNVRLAISAGAPLPLELEQNVFTRTGIKIHNFYGSTECGGIAYDATDSPRNDPTCVGTPMTGVSATVAFDGCLQVSSRAVGETYWPEPSPNLGKGVFKTADFAELIGHQIFLRGRASDLINVAGRKLAPGLIEDALRDHPSVRECLVFGVPSGNAQRTEDIVAVVATSEPCSAEELREFLHTRLASWQLPREWWFVDSITPDRRGKVSRAEWRDRFLQAHRR